MYFWLPLLIMLTIYIIILILLFNVSNHLENAGHKLHSPDLSRAGRNLLSLVVILFTLTIISGIFIIFTSIGLFS